MRLELARRHPSVLLLLQWRCVIRTAIVMGLVEHLLLLICILLIVEVVVLGRRHRWLLLIGALLKV